MFNFPFFRVKESVTNRFVRLVKHMRDVMRALFLRWPLTCLRNIFASIGLLIIIAYVVILGDLRDFPL